jgi:hypothetical protein
MSNKEDIVLVSFTNIEADYMSDLVVNCETPSDIVAFTAFVEKTIASEMKDYSEKVQKIQKTFQDRVEALAPEYLMKDDKGQYIHGADGNPVPQQGKEEDWKNLFEGARNEMAAHLNKAGNELVTYRVDATVFHRFAEMFMRTPVATFIRLQQDPKELNRAYLMIYLISKRLEDAKTQVKGNTKKS